MIAGATPVGLMPAIELQRRGVGHLLVEQKTAPAYFVKALGTTPRMLEIWDQVGLARAALDAGLLLRGPEGAQFAGWGMPLQGVDRSWVRQP